MKILFKYAAILMLANALSFTACGGNNNDRGKTTVKETAGYKDSYTADSVTFNMVYVPGGLTFPTGINDDGTAIVSKAYWIGETEVTYELWQKVYVWAASGSVGTGAGQYTFANVGTMGDGTGDTNQHPVTTMNWRDSMVWCNALTEWYNAQKGTSYECVYTYSSAIIRDSQDSNATACDNAVASSTAKGFRLLASNEYELAARWRDDVTNTVSGFTNPYFTQGDSASGATTCWNDVTGAPPDYAGKLTNDLVAVYGSYWDGLVWVATGVTSTATVKSKVTGANSLGLYDMSGNVMEWCFDLSVSERVFRGGCWFFGADGLQVGIKYPLGPDGKFDSLGFRFARTQ